MIAKIVYFDEGAATDMIYIFEGGKTEETTSKVVKKTSDLAAKASAKAESKLKLFSFLNGSASAEVGGGFAREGQSIVEKALTNTILTDYLSLVEEENTNSKYIRVFSNALLYPYPESFSYFKMITPFMTMTEGSIAASHGIKFNVALMDKAFENGRGYYELIANSRNQKKNVLRFNINAFRNNYSISDLTKMRLQYHAIKVGMIPESRLTMKSEFSSEDKVLSGIEIMSNRTNSTDLPVYDVLFAGVNI